MLRVQPGRPSPLRVRRLLRGARLRDVAAATGLQMMALSEVERGERPLAGALLRLLSVHYQTAPERLTLEMTRWLAQDGAGEEAKGA
jgi:transcriptional regulator with XRE-family HTH domain